MNQLIGALITKNDEYMERLYKLLRFYTEGQNKVNLPQNVGNKRIEEI